jgi:hypothetical protein
MELERKAHHHQKINPFDIMNDEKQEERSCANHFFSSLLG